MNIAGLEIKGITCSSKDVKKGFAFVAIKGSCYNGRSFIAEALDKGASIIITDEQAGKNNLPAKAKILTVKNTRKFLAEACAEFYKHPSGRLRVTGITGTNGKTTISYLMEAIAKGSSVECGVIGTVNYRFKGEEICAGNTTPGPDQLQSLFAKMLERKVRYCAMEVSSHALDQERVRGINFSRAIFTNLTQDHLDYHKNMNKYFAAKTKLFRMLGPSAAAIINNDDKYGRRIKSMLSCRLLSYGINNKSTVMAKDIRYGISGTEFTLIAPGINSRIKTRLIGRYNVYNILAAVSWGLSHRLRFKDIKSAVEEFKSVPGRLERVASKDGRDIFVDYAHTPDALLNVISALRPLVAGRLMVVFGCGGQRDKSKRPKMGRIVTKLADYAFITSDNPRSENPLSIIKDIRSGIRKDNYRVIVDRARAIREAVKLTRKGDCLVIAGKGHEDYQVLKGGVLHFSDREAVKKCLR